jgi:hypothetical protein
MAQPAPHTRFLTAPGELAAYQAELDSVAFASPNATNPGRTITWSINGGLTTSTPVSSSVSVAPDPPKVTAGASVSYVAGGAPVTLDPGLSVSDAEAASLTAAT